MRSINCYDYCNSLFVSATVVDVRFISEAIITQYDRVIIACRYVPAWHVAMNLAHTSQTQFVRNLSK